eukprot:XP_024303366.1 spermatogenesis associated 6-like protein isoform X6 [Homo sapiens]
MNQYLETNSFPSAFPIMIQESMRFEKVFESAVDPGAVVDLLEMWDELAYYEENTRDFLFPEPKLTPSHPRRCREVLMKTALGFPGIAPKIEFSTRTAIRECVFLHRNRFLVDSAKPFGENISEHHLRRSRRKSKFSDFPFPTRRASSLDSLAANVKVIKEPDERIVLRSDSSSCLDSSQFGKSSSSKQGDADFHGKASFATYQHSTSPGPLDQPLLRERFHPGSQSTWKNIHERVCSLLTSHRAQLHQNKEDSTSEVNYIIERPSYPLKKYSLHEQRYF